MTKTSQDNNLNYINFSKHFCEYQRILKNVQFYKGNQANEKVSKK